MTPSLKHLHDSLPLCLPRDRRRISHLLENAARRLQDNQPADRILAQASADIDRSIAAREARLAQRPKTFTYPENLPVSERRAEIAEAINKHQVIILCGETGSGKTTQLPKICLELGRGIDGLIGHTQPRRIAARSVAARIAEEVGSPLGGLIGYKVRFNDKLSANSAVKLMTDGILLAETQHDRLLEAYDTIIIDEAHERSLNIDFLLGYLKQILPRRPDLKVIVTSATIDPERLSRHFNNAPILLVSGRRYPVEVRYREIGDSATGAPSAAGALTGGTVAGERPALTPALSQSTGRGGSVEIDLEDSPAALLAAVDELARAGPGDILIFMSGERDIREASHLLRKTRPGVGEILPLYARLSADEQMRIFKPHQGRRIILATNVAETSLTVPGIRYVIDPGLARMSRYSPRTKVQRLPIERISQASADQRKGRCGRVADGICIRLYSESDFLARAKYTEPEILRTNLAGVILQMKALNLGEIQDFPFIEPPDYKAIRDGYQTLHELGAIDEQNQLTPLGRDLARLPIDPRIGRMILAAREENAMREVLIIAAALSVQDPRERPLDQQQAADAAHAQWRDESSDFLSYLKLWDWYHEKSMALSGSKLRKACLENFLSYVRMREWRDIHRQLLEVVEELKVDSRGGRNRG